MQLQTVRQTLALTRQLHFPSAGFAARRTAQVQSFPLPLQNDHGCWVTGGLEAAITPPTTPPHPSLILLPHCPQVLAVVVAFVAFVWLVDGACSRIPRVILWTQANPGWLRRAVLGVATAASQRLTGG